jgi:ParB/RepB/Spo0J family partition protein
MSATTTSTTETVQQRTIQLSRIVVPAGFNPRGGVAEDRELEQLAESIRRHGVLQPIRVRATDDGSYALIAGERRYRAAVKAALMEIPAIIRPAGTGDETEEAELVVEAIVENDARCSISSVARAEAYQRLLDSGLTVKGVAEQLCTTQARVRDHLRILRLPAGLQGRVAGGEVPLKAVKPLAELAKIHAALAEIAASNVLEPDENYESYTWADVEHDALEVAVRNGELPDGVYAAHTAYPVDAFQLDEKTQKNLTALETIAGRPIRELRFGTEEVQQARTLGAAHGENWKTIIVGNDTARQLAADQIARRLKEARAGQRRQARTTAGTPTSGETGSAADEQAGGAAADDAARRAQRETDRQDRERAVAFNAEIGRGIYADLSRIAVDERVLKILASVDVTGKLAEIAMRGARYGFPGWVSESTASASGKTKLIYIERREEAERRASEYLLGARTPGEIAGRQIALIAIAVYADQHAVAQSNRSWHHVEYEGPWAEDVAELLDEIVAEKLSSGPLTMLKPVLEQRKTQRATAAADKIAREEARARVDGAEQRIPTLTLAELDLLSADVEHGWDRWNDRQSQLRQLIAARRKELDKPATND